MAADPVRKDAGPVIRCGCGCGGTLQQFDRWGRPRAYLPGHYLKAVTTKK